MIYVSLEMNRTDVIRRLHSAFPELGPVPEESVKQMQHIEDMYERAGTITIGAEVEVRFSSYFPVLYDAYLKGTSYDKLAEHRQRTFTQCITEKEQVLIPRLKLTEYCGVPKGKDKYYEFAFHPCYNPAILAYEIELLRRLRLIPNNFKHSLHVTIGGLGMSKKAGMILMALEILRFTSHERIMEAIDADRAISWGRRGRGGMRERRAEDELPIGALPLSLGKSIGIELRTLELPVREDLSAILFTTTFFLAHCATSKNPKFEVHWNRIVEELECLGAEHHLDVKKNWGRSYENIDTWEAFAKCLDKFDITDLIALINEIPKLGLLHHESND